jgi:indole-3-glycerol phosphate synthase
MRGARRFSQAISEGDGISLLADVADVEAARNAAADGADGLVVRDGVEGVRSATELPILWTQPTSLEEAVDAGADAVLLVADAAESDGDALRQIHAEALGRGVDCVVEVGDEDELQMVLDALDPEILLLPGRAHGDSTPLAAVLGLLADVPAGKLVVAAVDALEREDLTELERAGTDAVIVAATDVARLLGAEARA